MNAFEYIVSELLHDQGYWTRVGYRVLNLTKQDRVGIGKPSLPRPELDIVAFNAQRNEVLIVECKSYIDSPGVRLSHFDGTNPKHAKTFKFFNEGPYQKLVIDRLVEQLRRTGLISAENVAVKLAVAAGKIVNGNETGLLELFSARGWRLITPSEIAELIRLRAQKGYEDEVITIATKLLMRNPKTAAIVAEGNDLKGIHLIQKSPALRATVANPASTRHESGFWVLSAQRADALVGHHIFLHERKRDPSFMGGKIVGYRVVSEGRWAGRVAFQFDLLPDCEGVTTSGEKWGMVFKITL